VQGKGRANVACQVTSDWDARVCFLDVFDEGLQDIEDLAIWEP
jgi:hypothetical protein